MGLVKVIALYHEAPVVTNFVCQDSLAEDHPWHNPCRDVGIWTTKAGSREG